MPQPPNNLPIYRVLTGPDDAAICHRINPALKLSHQLYDSPALTLNDKDVMVAQAIVWRGAGIS